MTSVGTTVTEADVRLVQELDRDPVATYATLAERLEVGERTVARRYRRLVELGLIRIVARTLPGFEGGVAWLIRTWSDTGYANRLGKALARQHRSRWVRTSTAGDQVVWGLVSSPGRGDAVLSGVTDDPRVRSVESMQLLEVWTVHGQAAVEWPGYRLDDLDRAIIAELGVDGRRPNSVIAAGLGVDPATVSRRTRRLVESGILYYEVEIDPAVHGLGVDTMVWIAMAPGQLGQLAKKVSRHPYCRFVAATSGRFSLVLNVVLPRYQDLVTFIDDELAGYGVISQEVVPMCRALKRGTR